MNIIETVFIVTLFLLFLGLWKIKQVNLKKKAGIDPNVMAKSPSNVQKYMSNITLIIMGYVVIIIIMHFTFVLFLEIQVRCEEDHLTSVHGEKYIEYKNRTKRYIPFVY